MNGDLQCCSINIFAMFYRHVVFSFTIKMIKNDFSTHSIDLRERNLAAGSSGLSLIRRRDSKDSATNVISAVSLEREDSLSRLLKQIVVTVATHLLCHSSVLRIKAHAIKSVLHKLLGYAIRNFKLR